MYHIIMLFGDPLEVEKLVFSSQLIAKAPMYSWPYMMKASTWKALESHRWDKQSIFKRYFFRPEKQMSTASSQ